MQENLSYINGSQNIYCKFGGPSFFCNRDQCRREDLLWLHPSKSKKPLSV